MTPAFYTLLNGGKESVALDFRAEAGRQQLRRILSHADVVITATRPGHSDSSVSTPRR